MSDAPNNVIQLLLKPDSELTPAERIQIAEWEREQAIGIDGAQQDAIRDAQLTKGTPLLARLTFKQREIERDEHHAQELAEREADASLREQRAAIKAHESTAGALAALRERRAWTPDATQESAPKAPETPAPLFSEVINDFMSQQDETKPMFRKYRTVMPMLLEVIGDKPVSELRQKQFNDYFELLLRLPPRWGYLRKKNGATVHEIAAKTWDECIGPKTFDDTYVTAVKQFLTFARRVYGDEGFPRFLTTEGIKYRGDRDEGERKQRAFTPDELKRLFEGPEARAFAENPSQAERYWLPLVGLYTGARVNEVCQLNPQCDIAQDAESGIWYFDITEDSETDERVIKAVKNDPSKRKVPIHSALLGLGFLSYVERVKGTGSALLFPRLLRITKN